MITAESVGFTIGAAIFVVAALWCAYRVIFGARIDAEFQRFNYNVWRNGEIIVEGGCIRKFREGGDPNRLAAQVLEEWFYRAEIPVGLQHCFELHLFGYSLDLYGEARG